jgi:hypothetical protein
MRLLIDDGIICRTNRKNLLNENFNFFGVSKCSHNTYGEVLVLLFANNIEK